MTEQEALKRHKELWQGIIDYVIANWSDIPDKYDALAYLKRAVLKSQGYKNITNDCWLCKYYRRVCHKFPLKSCVVGSLFGKVENAYIEMFFSNDKTEREKHYKEFIELAEKIRDIGDERIKE